MSQRKQKIESILKALAAQFLNFESNTSSLLTVTKSEISTDNKHAIVFFTVFPESFEKTALEFARRKRFDFKQFVKNNSRLGQIPQIDFVIDLGEKNRQKIDTLLNN